VSGLPNVFLTYQWAEEAGDEAMSKRNHGIEEPRQRASADPDDRALRWAQAAVDFSMYGLIVVALGLCLYVTL
jgi:hypothetical protein